MVEVFFGLLLFYKYNYLYSSEKREVVIYCIINTKNTLFCLKYKLQPEKLR